MWCDNMIDRVKLLYGWIIKKIFLKFNSWIGVISLRVIDVISSLIVKLACAIPIRIGNVDAYALHKYDSYKNRCKLFR